MLTDYSRCLPLKTPHSQGQIFNIPQPIIVNLLSLDKLSEADNDMLDVQQQ
jgi:hypothetical protein